MKENTHLWKLEKPLFLHSMFVIIIYSTEFFINNCKVKRATHKKKKKKMKKKKKRVRFTSRLEKIDRYIQLIFTDITRFEMRFPTEGYKVNET